MDRDKYAVRLATEQREELQHLIRVGKSSGPSDRQGADSAQERRRLGGSPSGGSPGCGAGHRIPDQAAIYPGGVGWGPVGPAPGQPASEVGRPGEAHLIALACSPAPEGHDHWTLRLLAGKVVELGLASSLSHETVRLHLKKRPQAVAEAGVVHSKGQRRVRGPHGGCAGSVRRTL